MKSEKFWENLKIHAGGDDKQRIQFAPPYGQCFLFIYDIVALLLCIKAIHADGIKVI